jgi:uncharacterized protein YndB with AHSA1/START domain
MEVNADSIQRELILDAPPERVWAALTQADALGAWFGTRASVDLRPGGQIAFTWDDPATGDHFTNGGVIEVVEAPRRFAFRWRPYAPPEQAERVAGLTTRVEFTLEPKGDGTRLRLVESGFSTLPPELRKTARDGNETGWTRELGELRDYIDAART